MTLSELQQLQRDLNIELPSNPIYQEISIPEITVDLWLDKYCHLSAKQLDNSRYVLIIITDNNRAVSFSRETTASIRIRKPDGNAVYNNATILEDSRVLIHLTDQILAVSGCIEMDILFANNGFTFSTKPIHIDVVSTPYPNSVITSQPEFDELNIELGMLSRLKTLAQQATSEAIRATEEADEATLACREITQRCQELVDQFPFIVAPINEEPVNQAEGGFWMIDLDT